jgi:hypothetical protein
MAAEGKGNNGGAEKGIDPAGLALGLSVYVVIGLAVAWNVSGGRAFLQRWWWIVVLAIVVVLGIPVGLAIRRRLKEATDLRRLGLVIFVLIPFLSILVGGVLFLPARFQVPALRTVFLLVVCLLPATLYYLFIATRKDSLLNELMTNLDRLGLLAPRSLPSQPGATQGEREQESARQNRLLTYLQKFEAIYGRLDPAMVEQLLAAADSPPASVQQRRARPATVAFTSIFTRENAVPVVLATVLIALGWIIALPPRISGTSGPDAAFWLAALTPERTGVNFAFLGAYFFSLQMLFRRYVRRDLRASAYVAVSLRIILAIIGTWVAVEAAKYLLPAPSDDLFLVLGFTIGVFPRVAWQVVQAAVKKRTGAETVLPSLQTQLPLSDLDGLTVWHEARFEEEDIENIPNMATADLVDLMLNTRLPPDRIVDWVDQAILYTHLGVEPGGQTTDSRRGILRSHGIRTATSLIEAYRKSKSYHDQDAFEGLLKGNGRSQIRTLADTLETNTNLELIRTWRRLGTNQLTEAMVGRAGGQQPPRGVESPPGEPVATQPSGTGSAAATLGNSQEEGDHG